MSKAKLILQDSGNTEYYTPLFIVQRARNVMGRIDLDPASTRLANQRVLARNIFTAKQDGLKKKWFGCVWMNHPYSREGNRLWIEKLVKSYVDGDIEQACCITYASTSEAWFRPLMDYPQCFLYPRTNYVLPSGGIKRGVTKGSVVTYLGPFVSKLIQEFSSIGKVKI